MFPNISHSMHFKQDVINVINNLWCEPDVCSISAYSYACVIFVPNAE